MHAPQRLIRINIISPRHLFHVVHIRSQNNDLTAEDQARNGMPSGAPHRARNSLLPGTMDYLPDDGLEIRTGEPELPSRTLWAGIQVEVPEYDLIALADHSAPSVATAVFTARAHANDADFGVVWLAVGRQVRQIVFNDPVWNGDAPRADQRSQRLSINQKLERQAVVLDAAVAESVHRASMRAYGQRRADITCAELSSPHRH